MNLHDAWEIVLLALCLWREARNQNGPAITAVACSIRNRVQKPGWWGHDWVSVILCGQQYSSFNRDDPNATLLPSSTDSVFPVCLEIAESVWNGSQADTVNGAESYYDLSIPEPEWAKEMTFTVRVEDFKFFKA